MPVDGRAATHGLEVQLAMVETHARADEALDDVEQSFVATGAFIDLVKTGRVLDPPHRGTTRRMVRRHIEHFVTCRNRAGPFDKHVRHAVEFGDFRLIEHIFDGKIAFVAIEPDLIRCQHGTVSSNPLLRYYRDVPASASTTQAIRNPVFSSMNRVKQR